MSHRCHAIGCGRRCSPHYLMCRLHWGMVYGKLQQRVLANYRQGQEVDKTPSKAWLLAAREAIYAVAVLEGHMADDVAQVRLNRLAEALGETRE